MRTLRVLTILALFVSCQKEGDNCKCIERVTDHGRYQAQACNPESENGIRTMERSQRYWEQYQRDYPCN
ncbi:hypothetical protein [Arenibacter amylolyticus]|uniref:hypothetical protein n=1 Tax=Arenibacter amylolyticus TaxID=1406873 RepID=UPI000A383BFC|nr:hypothetical protein [Arenibacter amylolyticus]